MRGLELPPECVTEAKRFFTSVDDMVSFPYVHASNVHFRNDRKTRKMALRPSFVRLRGLTIGGGRLSPAKRTHLRTLSESDRDREFLFDLFTETIGHFGPVLYVGEANNLRRRINDHVAAGTDLIELANAAGMGPEHLVLYCLPLPKSTQPTRTLIEQVLTHILVAPLTRRPG